MVASKTQLISEAHRINVVGTSGSGKTTFAQRLARIKGVPCIEMDGLFWQANWRESTDVEFMPRVEQALAPDSWVLDGNYTRTIPIKWSKTQLVIFIDLPFCKPCFASPGGQFGAV